MALFYWYDEANTTGHLSNSQLTSDYVEWDSFSFTPPEWQGMTTFVCDNEVNDGAYNYLFSECSELEEIDLTNIDF